MKTFEINFKDANQNLRWILLVGVGLGVANFALGVWPTLGQSLVQQIVISFVIGYSLLLVIHNVSLVLPASTSKIQKNLVLLLLFGAVGVAGSEAGLLVKSLAFQQGEYHLLDGGGIYLFNAILSAILGFGMLLTWTQVKSKGVTEDADSPAVETPTPEPKTIPIRQGEATLLYPVQEIVYLEAYDNYSYLYDLTGKKHFCNYSLRLLEEKLGCTFLRVHRKYLINRDQISQIKPYFKGRYVIGFKSQHNASITSSSSYAEAVKAIIQL